MPLFALRVALQFELEFVVVLGANSAVAAGPIVQREEARNARFVRDVTGCVSSTS